MVGKEGQTGGILVLGTIDGGAMICVLDCTVWVEAELSLGSLSLSAVVCRMANGSCIRSSSAGLAWIKVAGIRWLVGFEVLDSKGAFGLLVGKTWLKAASTFQDFAKNTLILPLDDRDVVVLN
ncbi:hypothetical protein BDV93DRAFT_458085, partial [Ceratobasidium sp. AG-I]